VSAYEDIRTIVLERVEDERLDPRVDVHKVTEVITTEVRRYQDRTSIEPALLPLRDPSDMEDRIRRSISGFGPLTDVLARSDIEEILIEGSRVSFIDGTGRLQALEQTSTEDELYHIVKRLLDETDRRLDQSSPMVQARVLDGSARLTAVIPPVSDEISVTIRKYALRRETLQALVNQRSLSAPAAGFLWAIAQARTSLVLSGQPSSGKTTMLSALLAASPSHHIIRCAEEVRELNVPLAVGSFYETRPPSLDGKGEISLRGLVKTILGQRPFRIVVGEVRGAEAFELTRAANAGCGFYATVHANTARDGLKALVNAAMMAGENVQADFVRQVFADTIDFVVHLDADPVARPDGGLRRRVMEILQVLPTMAGADFTTEPIFHREHLGSELKWTGRLPHDSLRELLDRSLPEEFTVHDILEGRVSPL